MKYKKILLKLSGESLMGEQEYGISPYILEQYAKDIRQVKEKGVEIAVVIGGGNIFRGLQGAAKGMDRIQGDYMGMLATIINSMALQAELEKQGIETELFSGLEIEPICKASSGRRIQESSKNGKVVIIGGGTGNPFFTTDTASALRAIEMRADIILKGTRVDGVYTSDPEKNPDAKKYDILNYDEALTKKLKIMDLTAFALCQENNMPIYVFDMNKKGNLLKVVNGEPIGTIICAQNYIENENQ
ncbi:MAG TPA: UMP kinase [Candidatus Onthomorpha intestinigallinarum]|uniref:Uridylate kinase n=1 Tax=Candidatus Onthomorpha intestinigallinarum TaxID=2840880 RepID=A0A9D1RHA4_9BACT|nr:UMP kinase [Candidatus Onthomorpha intestinigallinarum]